MLSRVVSLWPGLPEPIRTEHEFLTYRLQQVVFRKLHRGEEARQAQRRRQVLGIDVASLTVDLTGLGNSARQGAEIAGTGAPAGGALSSADSAVLALPENPASSVQAAGPASKEQLPSCRNSFSPVMQLKSSAVEMAS